MAKGKKGALYQLLVPMVDATDFASIESAITESDFNSGVTKKFYGCNHGGSAATTSGTISKTGSLVRSGVFRITLKGTENNYDVMMARFTKTGCAEQIFVWENVDNDDSDLMSYLVAMSAAISDAHSAAILGASHASDAHSAATLGASRALLLVSSVSDLQSYLVGMSGMLSDAHSAAILGASHASDAYSAALIIQSRLSDLDSRLVSDLSDVLSAAQQTNSRVLVVRSLVSDVQSALSDAHSDLASRIGGVTATLSASDISDIASAVWANVIGARVDSRVLLVQSRLSDFDSRMVSDISDLKSALSDAHSDLASKIGNVSVALTASDISDIASAVAAAVTTVTASDISDIASAVWAHAIGARVDSRVLLVQSRVSDIQSALAAGVDLGASSLSDLRSAIAAVTLTASDISDIASAVWAHTIGARVDSRVLVVQSMASDAYSAALLGASAASDAHSAATVAASRALLNQSRISDVYSLLSDVSSDLGVMSGVLSDTYSAITAGVEIGASSLSDLRSAITANGLLAAGAEPTTVIGHTDTIKAKIDWLAALSRNKITQTATLQSLRNDADNSTIASAPVSDDGTTFTRGEFA